MSRCFTHGQSTGSLADTPRRHRVPCGIPYGDDRERASLHHAQPFLGSTSNFRLTLLQHPFYMGTWSLAEHRSRTKLHSPNVRRSTGRHRLDELRTLAPGMDDRARRLGRNGSWLIGPSVGLGRCRQDARTRRMGVAPRRRSGIPRSERLVCRRRQRAGLGGREPSGRRAGPDRSTGGGGGVAGPRGRPGRRAG